MPLTLDWLWKLSPHWIPQEGGLGDLNYPLVADLKKEISKAYGVLTEDGIALRGLFIIDKEGVIQHATVNNLAFGRSVDETKRVLQVGRKERKREEEELSQNWGIQFFLMPLPAFFWWPLQCPALEKKPFLRGPIWSFFLCSWPLAQAIQYVQSHPDEVCPAGWKPGDKTMNPSPAKSKEYFKKLWVLSDGSINIWFPQDLIVGVGPMGAAQVFHS